MVKDKFTDNKKEEDQQDLDLVSFVKACANDKVSPPSREKLIEVYQKSDDQDKFTAIKIALELLSEVTATCDTKLGECSRLREALEHTIRGLAIVDSHDKITFTNKFWVKSHGYEKIEEVLGKPLTLFHDIASSPESIEDIKIKALKNKEHVAECVHMLKNGNKISFWNRWVPTKDTEGNQGFIITGEDISELKKREKTLESQKDDLARMNELMVGRELKMVELKGTVQMLKKQLKQAKSNKNKKSIDKDKS